MDGANNVKTTRLYNLLSAVIAFILWGSWAFFANSGHGGAAQLSAFITQGSASFVITLVMTRFVAMLFSRIHHYRVRAVIPAAVTVSVTGTLLITVHYLAGTPEVIATVSPALSVAFLYCLYTTYKLQQQTNNNHGER